MRKFCAVAVNGIKTGQTGRKPCRGKNIPQLSPEILANLKYSDDKNISREWMLKIIRYYKNI